MGFFEDMKQSLSEAIEMEKGNIPVVEKENMPAPTFVAVDEEKKLIDEFTRLRKEHCISQSEIARRTGNNQQAISRVENKENCPSLKLFCSMVYALGYDLEIVKR